MLRVEFAIPLKPRSIFQYTFTVEENANLVFGVLEIEHDAAVFALVSVVCHLE